jgi:hypothetical protein
MSEQSVEGVIDHSVLCKDRLVNKHIAHMTEDKFALVSYKAQDGQLNSSLKFNYVYRSFNKYNIDIIIMCDENIAEVE